MQVNLHPNVTTPNSTLSLLVPTTAVADSSQDNCGNETQSFSLRWIEKEDNSTLKLARNMTIQFGRINST